MAKFFGRFRKEASWYWFLLPFFIIFMTFTIYPVLYTTYLSFCDADLMGVAGFVGWDNYTKLLHDPLFWEGFRNSFQITITYLIVGMSLALFFAVLLNRKIKFKGIFRTMFFLPVITSEVAVTYIFQQLYEVNFGLINKWLGWIGIRPVGWLVNDHVVIWAITVLALWQGIGYYMILFLAGLQSIPEERYEAAAIDGAGPVRTFFSITLPSLTSTVVLNAVLGGINILQIFTPIRLLFPQANHHTNTMGFHVYLSGFQFNYRGYASALALAILIIVLLFSMLQRMLVHRVLGEE